MASTTANLNLKLLGTSSADRATLFEDWRQDINGESSDSNMQIIDRAYQTLSTRIDAASRIDAITDAQIDALFT